MAVRGSQAKAEIQKKILETFPGSFITDKMIRIPMTEDGEVLQIKCTLTAAKDIIDPQPKVTQTAPAPTNSEVPFEECMNPPEDAQDWKMTKEEEKKVAAIMSRLGM